MSNLRKPQVGDSILFFANSDDTIALSNGKKMGDPVAAIVTQVWGPVMINLKLIPDHAAMQDRGSVGHKSLMPGGGGYYWLFPEEYYQEGSDGEFVNVLDNSDGFRAFLDSKGIKWTPNEHLTSIHLTSFLDSNANLFLLGQKYQEYKDSFTEKND